MEKRRPIINLIPNTWDVKTKVMVTNLVLLFFWSALSITTVFNLTQHQNKLNELLDNTIEQSKILHQMQKNALTHRRFEKDYFLNIGKPQKQKKYLQRFEQASHQLDSLTQRLYNLTSKKGESNITALLKESQEGYQKYKSGFLELCNRLQNSTEITPQIANEMQLPFKEFIYLFESRLDSALAFNANQSKEFAISLEKKLQSSIFLINWLLGFCLILSISSIVWLNVGINKSIRMITKQIIPLGKGKLRKINYNRSDEFADVVIALNAFIGNLGQIILQINDQLHSIDEAEQSVQKNSANILEKMNELTREMNAMSQSSFEATKNANEITQNALIMTESMESLSNSLQNMSKAIAEVNENCSLESKATQIANEYAQSTFEEMSRLGKSAKKISAVVKVINEISSQTKLLALNASIEAASAGEAGRGFAVVSEEVKTLANQSASATLDISSLVGEVQERTLYSIQSNQTIKNQIEEIDNYAQSIALSVEKQTNTTTQIAENMEEVRAKSILIEKKMVYTREIIQGLTQMSSHLETIAQNTKKGAAESHNQTKHLKEKANELKKTLTFFKIAT